MTSWNQLPLLKCVLLIMVSIMGTEAQRSQPVTDFNSFDGGDDEKRGHSIMRIGKRESWDDSVDEEPHPRFDKRQSSSNEDSTYPELFRILRSEDRDSWKRGHNIMRFGKRADDHHFIHFGKRDSYGEPRHSILSFGKREKEPLQRSIIGLDNPLIIPQSSAESQEDIYESLNAGHKRFPHSMIHFGKRIRYGDSLEDGDDEDEDSDSSEEDIEKRAHSMIHFGKRPYDDKKSHSLMHFGKRPFQGHSNMHFGKRPFQGHSNMHFGKRDSAEKRTHSLMHFGKRLSDEIKRAHSMIHFGKRYNDDEDKRSSHAVMHFGKRSDPAMGRSDIGGSDNNDLAKTSELNRDVSQESIHIRKRRNIDEPFPAHKILRFGRSDLKNNSVANISSKLL